MLPIVFSLILGFTHFWNEKIQITQEAFRVRFISFIAGITVTYVFLSLLPEVYRGIETFEKFIFIALLAGFSSAYITEKYVYQHSSPQTLKERLGAFHSLAFFIYHLLLGVIFVKLNKISNLNSVLFFLPVLFYSSVGAIALEKIHEKVWERPVVKLLLSTSTLVGVLIADFFLGAEGLFNLLFGFVVGTFLYVALIDFVPKESHGRPEYFVVGVLVYTLIITATII